MEQILPGMLLSPCWIFATQTSGSSEGKKRSNPILARLIKQCVYYNCFNRNHVVRSSGLKNIITDTLYIQMIIVFLVALVVSAAGFASLIVQLCVTICTLRAGIHRDTISMIYRVLQSQFYVILQHCFKTFLEWKAMPAQGALVATLPLPQPIQRQIFGTCPQAAVCIFLSLSISLCIVGVSFSSSNIYERI